MPWAQAWHAAGLDSTPNRRSLSLEKVRKIEYVYRYTEREGGKNRERGPSGLAAVGHSGKLTDEG